MKNYPINKHGKVFPLELIKKYINLNRKNYVVLSVGGNDSRVCLPSLPQGWEKVWEEMNNPKHNYTNNYKKIVNKLLEMNLTGIILVSVYLPYVDFVGTKDYLEISKVLEKSKELLFKIAHEFNLPVIDLSKSFDNKNRTHYGSTYIEPSNISSMFIANLVTYVINDFDFEGNVSKIYSGQNLKNITSVNNINTKKQNESITKPEMMMIPIDLRKIIYEYSKPFYIFRNITTVSDESDCCYTKEEAYNKLLKFILEVDDIKDIKDDDVKELQEYVDIADYYSVYLLDFDHENIYSDHENIYGYKLVAEEDDFNDVKSRILNSGFLVSIGYFGFAITAILEQNDKVNEKKLKKLKQFLIRYFETSEWYI